MKRFGWLAVVAALVVPSLAMASDCPCGDECPCGAGCDCPNCPFHHRA